MFFSRHFSGKTCKIASPRRHKLFSLPSENQVDGLLSASSFRWGDWRAYVAAAKAILTFFITTVRKNTFLKRCFWQPVFANRRNYAWTRFLIASIAFVYKISKKYRFLKMSKFTYFLHKFCDHKRMYLPPQNEWPRADTFRIPSKGR